MRCLLLACLLTVAARGDDGPVTIRAVTCQAGAGGVTIRVDLSAPCTPRAGEIANPYRVYYDFPGALLRASVAGTRQLNHARIAAVRVGQFSAEPPIARIVLDLVGRQSVRLATADEGRTVFIGIGEGGGRPDAPAAGEPRVAVGDARWERQETADARYTVALSGAARVDSFYLSAPDRLVVDLQGASLEGEPVQPSGANDIVQRVRASQFEADVVRLVFDLKRSAAHEVAVRRDPDRLEVRLSYGESRGRLVIVDPGHGDHDPGARGVGGAVEKVINLQVGLRVRNLLQEKGIGVRMTRDDDTFIPLYDRPALANRLGADCFVSIHCNAMPEAKRGERSGTELYYFTPQSELFASIMLQEVARSIGLPARGTFTRSFVVVREAAMPAVLVELGYVDHAGDGAKLMQPEFQQQCAIGIVHGVQRFLERQPRRETPPPGVSEPAGGATAVTPLLRGDG